MSRPPRGSQGAFVFICSFRHLRNISEHIVKKLKIKVVPRGQMGRGCSDTTIVAPSG